MFVLVESSNIFLASRRVQLFEGLVGSNKPKNRGREFPSPLNDKSVYVPPKERAAGRPHNLGWLQYLDDMEDVEEGVFGQSPSGEIIMD